MTSRSLAIETATDTCSVALAVDGTTVAEASLRTARRHAEELVPLTQSLFRHGRWKVSDLDYVAVSEGPGSYTGLRIGLSTAKGICYATGAALVAVPTLDALAAQVAPYAAKYDLIVAALDARRGSIFAAAFVASGENHFERVAGPSAVKAEAFVSGLPSGEGTCWLVGDGAHLVAAAIDGSRPVRLPELAPVARTVAGLAHERWISGTTVDPATFEPRYLREFVAKTPAQDAFEKLPF